MSPAQQLDALYARLAVPDLAEWEYIEVQIEKLMSDSGSAAMNLLLKRGRDAMSAEEFDLAIDHYTALTDHAPEFAEGWNARATAFFAKGLYGPALEDVQHALAIEPRHINALEGLGIIMRELGYTDLALRAYQRAAAIHPHDPDIQRALTRLEQQVGALDL